MAPPSDLPEAARRRLAEGSFSSGLSVADFAACLSMGLEPLGLVQGFCAVEHSYDRVVAGLTKAVRTRIEGEARPRP